MHRTRFRVVLALFASVGQASGPGCKKGKYEFLCTLPGHASAGMKGILGIGVAIAAPKGSTSVTSTTPKTTTTTPSSNGGGAATCASPQSSTVTVTAFDFGYTVSPTSFHCGTITFNIKNNGPTEHDFDFSGDLPPGAGISPIISTGQTSTLTVSLPPGTWNYYCSVPTHQSLGMYGSVTVTA